MPKRNQSRQGSVGESEAMNTAGGGKERGLVPMLASVGQSFHPFLLVVHPHPLESDDLPRRSILRLVHLPVRSLPNLLHRLKHIALRDPHPFSLYVLHHSPDASRRRGPASAGPPRRVQVRPTRGRDSPSRSRPCRARGRACRVPAHQRLSLVVGPRRGYTGPSCLCLGNVRNPCVETAFYRAANEARRRRMAEATECKQAQRVHGGTGLRGRHEVVHARHRTRAERRCTLFQSFICVFASTTSKPCTC